MVTALMEGLIKIYLSGNEMNGGKRLINNFFYSFLTSQQPDQQIK